MTRSFFINFRNNENRQYGRLIWKLSFVGVSTNVFVGAIYSKKGESFIRLSPILSASVLHPNFLGGERWFIHFLKTNHSTFWHLNLQKRKKYFTVLLKENQNGVYTSRSRENVFTVWSVEPQIWSINVLHGESWKFWNTPGESTFNVITRWQINVSRLLLHNQCLLWSFNSYRLSEIFPILLALSRYE